MKMFLLGIFMLSIMTCQAKNVHVSDALINSIILVESENNASAIGDKGKAIGIGQIHSVCVDDVNRILGKKVYKYSDRKSPKKSREMMRIYLKHYGSRYERLTKQKATVVVLAQIWNGGPDGWKKVATVSYAKKVIKRLIA